MEVKHIDQELTALKKKIRSLEKKRRRVVKKEHTRIEKDIHTVLRNMVENPTPEFTQACVKQTHHLLKQMNDLRRRARTALPFSERTEKQLKRFEKVLRPNKKSV